MSTRARPSRRRNRTFALRVGSHRMYVTLACFDDGAPMELFVDIAKEGTTIRGLMDAIARLVSRSWQYGVPAADIIRQFEGTKFMPGGIGAGHPAIEGETCGSLLDAIGRVLEHELKKRSDW